jgi:hypothetical protein
MVERLSLFLFGKNPESHNEIKNILINNWLLY